MTWSWYIVRCLCQPYSSDSAKIITFHIKALDFIRIFFTGVLKNHYYNFTYAGSRELIVDFEYTFIFDGKVVEYSYGKPCSGYLAESREENYHSHTRTIVDGYDCSWPWARVGGYDSDRNYGILRDGNVRDDHKNQSSVQTDDGLDEHKKRRSVKSLIKDGLIRKNMSQKALAEKMSVSPSRINAYVTGRAMPTLKMAAKLCKILEIAPEAMLQCRD